MRPLDINCNQLSVNCVPNPLQLRPDDVAAVSRLYPVTSSNISRYPGHSLTAASTASIHGHIYFRRGQGMQGVNIVARPITPGVLQPNDGYATASVTGFLFTGNQGNAVTGNADFTGTLLSKYGSEDSLLEGFYDLSALTLPADSTQADYELTLEAVNPLYTGTISVGPYAAGSPTPSGTLAVITVHAVAAGSSTEQDFTIVDSAGDLQAAGGGVFSAPATLHADGAWEGRIPAPGQSSWFALPVLGGRHFTIESQAVDEAGIASENKLRPVVGIWDASGPETAMAAASTLAPFNGALPGLTTLGVDTLANGELRMAIADQRGDGRADYAYRGRVLYAATVTPARLLLGGGVIQIAGTGFRPGMTVTLGSQIVANVTRITPQLITATAPASATFQPNLDLIVSDPASGGIAVIAGGISYGAALNDTLSLTSAPGATVNVGVPAVFAVRAYGPDQTTPLAGVPVTFQVQQGSAVFAECAQASCVVITTEAGYATAHVVPAAVGFIRLQASLTTGSPLYAELTAIDALSIHAVSNSMYLAPGALVAWTTQADVVAGGLPLRTAVDWSGQGLLSVQAGTTSTTSQGLAMYPWTLGPWPAGTSAQMTACLAATSTCAPYSVYVVHPETENLVAFSGTTQFMQASGTLMPVMVRLVTPTGEPVAGGAVSFRASIRSWSGACASTGACSSGRLLSSQSVTILSDVNGLATFLPTIPAGLAVDIVGQIVAGSSATLPFQLEIHP